MFLNNILTETKSFIESVYLFDEYQVQITPDDRPFPNSGDKTITLFGSEAYRKNDKQSAQFQYGFEISINRKTGQYQYDHGFEIAYTEELISLSTITSLLCVLLESSNNLYYNIKNSIVSNISNIVSTLDSNSAPLTTAEQQLRNSLLNLTPLTPIKVLQHSVSPIPRQDAFFHCFNTKTTVELEYGNDRIQESGWSMKIKIEGPQIALPTPC